MTQISSIGGKEISERLKGDTRISQRRYSNDPQLTQPKHVATNFMFNVSPGGDSSFFSKLLSYLSNCRLCYLFASFPSSTSEAAEPSGPLLKGESEICVYGETELVNKYLLKSV